MDILNRLAPSAERISPEVAEGINFYNCGENFESVSCPRCSGSISIDWWQERMDDDFDGAGFKLAVFSTPCCGESVSLNELEYSWPQAFGRFSWTLLNPNISELSAAAKSEIESAAGVPLVAIRQHL